MNLYDVWVWGLHQGIGIRQFRQFYDDAFLVAISGLLRAIYREELVIPSSLCKKADSSCNLRIGEEPALVLPIAGNLPLQRIEAIGLPRLERNGTEHRVRTTSSFKRALRAVSGESEIMNSFDRLVADFDNSFANLVLNRILFHLGETTSSAIEPTYQGHTIHPFPALRRGPSLELIVECSHLSRNPIKLALLGVKEAKFISVSFQDYTACQCEWAGQSLGSNSLLSIPVHPWQIELSPIVKNLLELGIISTTDDPIAAVPLTSQRTCRILTTGFDVKLPVDARLTGEHRLLYPANVQNAPIVSALAKAALKFSNEKTIDFQYDIASITHPDAFISTHLSAIIRCPVPTYPEEQVVPALNLWAGRLDAYRYLRIETSANAHEVFALYCGLLMRGPVEFYARFGMAFEPHLQNVLIRIRDGKPEGIIVRDLDSTILDSVRVPSSLREFSLQLPIEAWEAMPPFNAGGRRLTHAMLHGHLAIVMSFLTRYCKAEPKILDSILEETWAEIISSTTTSTRDLVVELREYASTVKCLLRMRLENSNDLLFR